MRAFILTSVVVALAATPAFGQSILPLHQTSAAGYSGGGVIVEGEIYDAGCGCDTGCGGAVCDTCNTCDTGCDSCHNPCDACGGRGLFGKGCRGGCHGCRHGNRKIANLWENCSCNGSYKFPVPPLYTYHWPGLYSQQLMTDYHSPWRFPAIKPYTDEELPETIVPASYEPQALPAITTARRESVGDKMRRIYGQ